MTTPQPHVHADKISQYIKDTTQKVWCKPRWPGQQWSEYHCDKAAFPRFNLDYEWHVGHEPPQEPERMKLVFEGNAPWRVEPPEGTKYWYINECGAVYETRWGSLVSNKWHFKFGNCWRTGADAIAYRDAYRAAALGEGK